MNIFLKLSFALMVLIPAVSKAAVAPPIVHNKFTEAPGLGTNAFLPATNAIVDMRTSQTLKMRGATIDFTWGMGLNSLDASRLVVTNAATTDQIEFTDGLIGRKGSDSSVKWQLVTSTGDLRATTFTGSGVNGGQLVSVWQKQMLYGQIGPGVQAQAADRFGFAFNFIAAMNATSTNVVSLFPSSGYLSNLVVFAAAPASATTTFCLQTNASSGTAVPSPIDSSLKAIFTAGVTAITNDSAHSIICTSNMFGCMRFNQTTSPGWNAPWGWSVEWWHQ